MLKRQAHIHYPKKPEYKGTKRNGPWAQPTKPPRVSQERKNAHVSPDHNVVTHASFHHHRFSHLEIQRRRPNRRSPGTTDPHRCHTRNTILCHLLRLNTPPDETEHSPPESTGSSITTTENLPQTTVLKVKEIRWQNHTAERIKRLESRSRPDSDHQT